MERLDEEKILSYYRERMAASNPNKEGITAFDSYRERIDASNPYKERMTECNPCSGTLKRVIPSIKVLEETGSTNSDMKALLFEDELPEGTVLLTDYQTAGRGRRGRQFFSPKGCGIYFSILTRPKKEAVDALVITTHAAVAVVRAVKELYGISLSIKWVNDLFYEGKKVCGILAEGKWKHPKLLYCVMGIGLNLFTPRGGYPDALKKIAGSLFGEYNAEKLNSVNRNQLLATILYHYFSLCEETEVLEEYRDKNLVLGRTVRFLENGKEQVGRVKRITDKGELQIETETGEEKILLSGEVQFVAGKEDA